ncbi:MAG: UDP-N-acetylmuramate dehydrogenase [Bacteroidales bacterium]|nr:UDP-N-acetylmuramate dehydrogenase [Bacteroidales bacterium]
MIRFLENWALKPYNTFGVEARARYFFEFTEPEDLEYFVQDSLFREELPLFILGGGSNVLFLNDFDGLVLYPKIPGIAKIDENRQHVWLDVGAGEVWDEFVEFCVNNEWGGIENLSLIPGSVGAAPVQNIGAYGQEAGDAVERVKGYDLQQKKRMEFLTGGCSFGYRDSVFKRELKNRFVITSVVFRLEKFPEYNLSYGRLEEKVKSFGEVNMQNIRKAVIDIRNSKLPDVRDLANGGSFFKNPVVDIGFAETLRKKFPDVPVYSLPGEKAKLSAAWLIDKAGWKGRREGDIGVYEKQPLVLVNYGNATGKDIFEFSEKIKNSVFEKFKVSLEREVNCVA